MDSRYSLTIAPGGENHHGMEIIGDQPENTKGFTYTDLCSLFTLFTTEKYKCELIDLSLDSSNKANVLIIRDFVQYSNCIYNELKQDQWDKHMYCNRRKKVLNKRARHNLCYVKNKLQEPDYENKKGRIVDLNSKTQLCHEVDRLTELINRVVEFNPKVVEGNHYYNEKCGIGYHGDTERKIVVAMSIGKSSKIKWQWYKHSKRVNDPFEVTINDSDVYIMSEKAVGYDWKYRSRFTLRHAAGAFKYIK
jgi:hypothetical protein